jgi:hypothetical protein
MHPKLGTIHENKENALQRLYSIQLHAQLIKSKVSSPAQIITNPNHTNKISISSEKMIDFMVQIEFYKSNNVFKCNKTQS